MDNVKRGLIGLGFLCLVACTGCATKDRLNKMSYSQIQPHASTQADVEALIGEPTSKFSDMWIYQRPDDHLTVMIDFDPKGQVTRKQWVDGVQGAWDDTNNTRKP
jgi:hypothetical protein